MNAQVAFSPPARLLVSAALAFGGCGIVQFWGLVLRWSPTVTLCVAILGFLPLVYVLSRAAAADTLSTRDKCFLLAAPLLATGLVTWRGWNVASYWGEWDAWAMWNYHARFLQDRVHWDRLFLSTHHDHPEYPLALPAGIAFLQQAFRLSGQTPAVSYAIAFATTLGSPLLLAASLYRRSIAAAVVGAGALCFSALFVRHGLSQYADTLLGLYLLIFCITVRGLPEDRLQSFACGAALGMLLWTKSEGLILVPLAIATHAPMMARQRRWKAVTAGFLVPLVTWAFFKGAYAPPGDLPWPGITTAWACATSEGRAALIWQYCSNILWGKARYLLVALALTCALCIRKKRSPGPTIVFLLLAAAVYSSIYLITPYDPDWHLRTSYDRLLHGLMPAALWACLHRVLTLLDAKRTGPTLPPPGTA